VLTPAEVSVGDLLWARRLLVSEAALAEIVRILGPAAKEAVA
jgi:hypothetical protein